MGAFSLNRKPVAPTTDDNVGLAQPRIAQSRIAQFDAIAYALRERREEQLGLSITGTSVAHPGEIMAAQYLSECLTPVRLRVRRLLQKGENAA